MGRANIYRYILSDSETFLNVLNENYITRILGRKFNIKNIKVEDLIGLSATATIDSDQQNVENNIEYIKLFYHEIYNTAATLPEYIKEIDSIDMLSGTYKHPNPTWMKYANQKIYNVPYLSPFCLIFIKIKKYKNSICYVISYGSGYLVLDRGKAVDSFGLDIVRRLVKEDEITKMKQTSPLKKGLQTTTSIYSGGSLSEHTYDKINSILTGISGRVDETRIEEYTNQPITSRSIIQGGTGLSLLLPEKQEGMDKTKNEHIEDIIKTVKFLEDINNKDSVSLTDLDYQEQIKDNNEIKELDKILYQKIRKGSSSKIFITPPPDIKNLDTEGKTLSLSLNPDHSEEIDDLFSLSVDHIKKFMRNYTKNDGSKPVKIILDIQNHYNGEKTIEYSNKITNWLSAILEHTLKGRKKEIYWLVNGKWYRIAAPFLQELDKYFTDIEEKQREKYPMFNKILNNTLNSFSNNFSESKYNAYLAKNISQSPLSEFHEGMHKSLILDKGNVAKYHIKFYDKYNELADLYIADGTYIHVKNYKGGAQGISHLVSQSLLSTRWLLEDRNASTKIFKSYFREIKRGKHKGKRKIESYIDDNLNKGKNKDILNINKEVFKDFTGNEINYKCESFEIKRVLLIILYKSEKPLTNLGRVSLYHHIQKLKEYGIEVDVLFSKVDNKCGFQKN